ncbi:hypothetical protein RchiOBHm_Chr6g0312071 [Rosa chinensis]|uniref:Uncharacterized protein n=1 Tax=Rosa chinensis TaxID=74649 RepID=A0A2P6Q1J0_ROSCH|nr:hypothetical protein RchiOBHm_Chr6g0312071 [Rosa chinensis]
MGSDPIKWDCSICMVAEDNVIDGEPVIGGDPVSPSVAKIAVGLQLHCDGGDGNLSPMLDCGGDRKGYGGSGEGDPTEGGGSWVARYARVCYWALRLLGLEWTFAYGWGIWACFWTVDFLCDAWVSSWAKFNRGSSIWAALMNEDGVDDDTSSSTPNFI